jgi:hypothetical protein
MNARAKNLAACLACATACIAAARAHADGVTWPNLSSGPLQDNSFLIEEAYNQERGVVQHIVNGLWNRSSEDWSLTFTQEWPVPDERHQFSYTLLQKWAGDPSDESGFGPVMLNYRYQALMDEARHPAVAPRLSVILPSGTLHDEFGLGSTGVQVALPASKQLGRHWEVNLNLGGTIFPSADTPWKGDRSEQLIDGSAGGSVIWQPYDAINVLCEVLIAQTEQITPRGGTAYHTHPLVNPGVRVGWNGPGGVQWVLGAGLPIGFGGDAGELGVFLYLSIENAFTAAARRERDW